MHVLLYFERHAARLQVHADGDVKRLVLICKRVVIRVLDVASGVLVPSIHVDIILDKRLVEVVYNVILARKVNHGTLVALLVNKHDGRNAGLLGHEGVVGTEIRRDVYYAGTVFRGYIVALDYAERTILHRTNQGQQLLIVHSYEVCTLIMSYYIIRYDLVTFRIRSQVCPFAFRVKVRL